MVDLQFPTDTKGLRPGIDERKSCWVAFPHLQRRILLPSIRKSRKIIPVIDPESKQITVRSEDPDETLGKLVDDFTVNCLRAGWNMTFTLDAIGEFYEMVRHLINVNYDLPDEQVMQMLTMTQDQFHTFFSIILVHCQGK